jgi:hypothetical protein
MAFGAPLAMPWIGVGAEPTPGVPAAPAGKFREPARELPVEEDADVIVCGAGPAGVAAALSAARCGAKVRLFEVHGCLGGIWTAGLLTYIFDFDKPGITSEIARELDARSARAAGGARDRFVYDPEKMKVLLEDLCAAAGVKIRLFTAVAAAYRDAAGSRLETVVTESKGGREAWRAKAFIDCTGDGDLGSLAGCQWDIGRGKDRPCQPMTLNALVVVKDPVAIRDFISFYGTDSWKSHAGAVKNLLAEFRRAGVRPSYGNPTLFPIRDNLLTFMVNHEYGVRPYEIDKLTEATVRARAEVHRLVDALRKLGGVWEGLQLAATAEQIGVRDGRRIRGRATVTIDDLLAGSRQPDAVCRVTFNVDVHAATAEENATRPISHENVKMKPYDIPLGALIAGDVDGLVMAGRCISGDFLAHASYRVTGNATATGEAAGAVAALAATTGRLPHQVPWPEAQQALAKAGLRTG